MNRRLYFWLLFLWLSVVVNVYGEVTPYEWDKSRSRYSLSPAEAKLGELVLKHHVEYEFVLADKQFLMYSTIHRIVLVNNNEAIQKHNRIVISMNSTLELTELKARSISKEGKIVYFDQRNLKELKEEASGNAYRIFAIEGVELGSEIEYYFTRKMSASLFDRIFMQTDAVTKSSSFRLICPGHLKFDFKTYHGFPEIKKEEGEDQNVYSVDMADVPAMKTEPFSHFDPNRKRIEFKLAFNTARSQARMYTWDEAAKTFHAQLNTLTKDEEKALEKFVKTLQDNAAAPQAERIRNIEERIKGGIQVNAEISNESLSQISSVVKYKIASRQGITKLFLGVFNSLGIPCHTVVTCSRENVRFDGDFDSWAYLDDYALYFPDTKGFLAPYFFETRYPLIPAVMTAHKGLFIEPFSMGEVRSALASIQDIPAADYALNHDNMAIDVTFNDDLSVNTIRQERHFGGYNAMYFAPYYALMTTEQRTNMVEELTKQISPDAKVNTWTAKPIADKNNSSFLIDVAFESTHFLAKAGPRVLFKVGELIGQQVEMYRDDARITEVENEFNRLYDRVIKINIPAGYTIKNLADLKVDITYQDKGATPFQFKSDYTFNDGVLEIRINEFYKEIYVPLSRYEDFRKVVNAAADFNKVTLVMERKK